jgi:hypothetical protein
VPLSGPVLNSEAIVDGTAEARFMPLNGALLNSAAIVDWQCGSTIYAFYWPLIE